jgi:hypothetical protein
MLSSLVQLEMVGPDHTGVGICANVHKHLCLETEDADDADWLPLLWKSWPDWSGCDTYPVPASRDRDIGGNEQYAYNMTACLWDRDTEYGQLRWELLEHCIETLQEAIEHANQD